MRQRTYPVLMAAGALTLFSLPAVAAGDDGDAVAAAVDAFTDVVTDAGFVSGGPVAADPDMLDVVPDDDATSEDASYACTEDIAALVEADGSLVGETTRAFSDSYEYAPDGTLSTDPVALSDADNITASAVSVDDEGRDELAAIVAAFGGDELRSCVLDSFTSSTGSAAADDPVTVEVDDDLGIGDQSSSFTISSTAGAYRFDSTLLFARVDNRLATIIFFRSGGPDSGLDPTAALAAMTDAFAG